ncbi:MAG: NAD+ synthase [Elusimicrobia bacterium GWA2_69_24]|nr:MAG: NAD+ synthase [Elusimicrobia bacterium GWA2_69_24]HBL17511.1 NAD+ synthase [Elusimicrobiota bacterium]
MKIAIAQINTTVGDFPGNLEKIRSSYARAVSQGAELVVFPELALCGYPPQDLLDRPEFVRSNQAALQELQRSARKAGMIVGYVEANPSRLGKVVFNAAALLHRGKVAARRYKTLLPTYDVFDEGRFFEPAPDNKPIPFLGKYLGLSICEDAWNDPPFWKRRLYPVDPVQRLARAGADLLVNIAASPFERGKAPLRHQLMRRHVLRHRIPMVSCALVGANDELVFDGNSFCMDASGRLLRQARSFEEDLILADPFSGVPESRRAPLDEVEEIYRALVLGIRDYARKCGFHEAILGLSGGIDSAVVAVLAADALGAGNVTGVTMPSRYSSEGSKTDSIALARNLGIRFIQIPIHKLHDTALDSLHETFRGTDPGVAGQNIQARMRGLLLMALSNKTGALLLATGNKSEMSVGYCTLYGDMNGGLAVIGDVLKTTVYALARWINRDGERIPLASIDKPPSAELKPNQKDQDDLPPYDVLDDILKAYVEDGKDAAWLTRRGHSADLVKRILNAVDTNEYKRRQAPPVLRVSPKAFGIGRRMPMARGK